jgi:hypothetical protein
VKVTKKVADVVSAYRQMKAELDRLTKESDAYRATLINTAHDLADITGVGEFSEMVFEYNGQAIARITVTERTTADIDAIRKTHPVIDEAIANKTGFVKTSTVTTVRTV